MPGGRGVLVILGLAVACGGSLHDAQVGQACSGNGDCVIGLVCDPLYATSGQSVCGDVLSRVCAIPCTQDADCVGSAADGGTSACIEECAGAPLRCIDT